ncbi:MAG: tRNA (adenosine(37)-N6)-dimethylallyltransferase MiaA [Candidatus Nanopelagicales bacterium]|nr:tRNA (adenosine(37)-N6)-dimethylallyltransferase MiaA [Candidatus Nanopelagicales bacterium]
MSAKPIVTIIGPTAVGKTALALDLARELDGELVGTDSMQAVRGMNIGTAKPTPQELGQIRHHMLDVWSVAHRADVVQFRGLAREAITGITTRKRIPIVVGGSVLYVKAILDQFDFPATDPEVRGRYEAMLDQDGAEKLHELLAEKDPVTATNILPGNGRRIVRALEVIELTGEPYHSRLPDPVEEFPSVRVGLEIDRVSMDARIEQRVDQMLASGLVEEVQKLESQGLRNAPTASRAIGYSQVLAHLGGEITQIQMREKIIYATQKFARRQQRWFRQDPRIRWEPWDSAQLTDSVLAHFHEVFGSE